MKTAEELLKTAEIGDVILFVNRARGVVIKGEGIPEEWVVSGKAIVLTYNPNGIKWGEVAKEYLGVMAKNVGNKKKGKKQ